MGPKGNVRPTSSLTVKIETKKVQADQDDDAATAPYLPADDPADDGGNANDAYSHDNTDDQGLGPHSTPAVPAPAVLAAATLAADGPAGQVRPAVAIAAMSASAFVVAALWWRRQTRQGYTPVTEPAVYYT